MKTYVISGHICAPKIYEFDGWRFEFGIEGAWPYKKNYEPRERAGRKFYSMLGKFMKLDDKAQAAYRIGGGCIRF